MDKLRLAYNTLSKALVIGDFSGLTEVQEFIKSRASWPIKEVKGKDGKIRRVRYKPEQVGTPVSAKAKLENAVKKNKLKGKEEASAKKHGISKPTPEKRTTPKQKTEGSHPIKSDYKPKAKQSEKEVIESAAKGNSVAQTKVYNMLNARVGAKVRGAMGSSIEAEDVVAKVMVKVLTKLPQYLKVADKIPIQAWASKIASNQVIDYFRSRENKESKSTDSIDAPKGEDDNMFMQIEDDSASGLEQIMTSEKAEALRGYIDELHPTYARVIKKFYLEEYSIKEISAQINVPEGSIKAQLNRARNALKTIILENL